MTSCKNPYQPLLKKLEKKIWQSYNKVKTDIKKHVSPKIIGKDSKQLAFLLGECNYLVRECQKIKNTGVKVVKKTIKHTKKLAQSAKKKATSWKWKDFWK